MSLSIKLSPFMLPSFREKLKKERSIHERYRHERSKSWNKGGV